MELVNQPLAVRLVALEAAPLVVVVSLLVEGRKAITTEDGWLSSLFAAFLAGLIELDVSEDLAALGAESTHIRDEHHDDCRKRDCSSDHV